MPIYAYRCASCGHAKDVLQKLSDAPLTLCPSCGASAFSKQLTAAGFQLKGSGWYATDFKGDKAAKKADTGDAAKTDAGTSEPSKPDTSKPDTTKTDGGKTDGGKTEASKGSDASAPAKSGDTGTSSSGGTGASPTPKAPST
jgi:putative FmdB family regulatory protein